MNATDQASSRMVRTVDMTNEASGAKHMQMAPTALIRPRQCANRALPYRLTYRYPSLLFLLCGCARQLVVESTRVGVILAPLFPLANAPLRY